MKTILVISNFIIVIFTSFILFFGIHDELYQEIEKNKLWHSDGSFIGLLPLFILYIFSLIYLFKTIKTFFSKR